MKLGYMARDQHGHTIHMTDAKRHPRKQLLDALGAKSAQMMFRDYQDGSTRHVGYVVGDQWFEIFEVHSWDAK